MIVWSVQFFGELRLAFWFWKSKDAAAPRWTLLLLITDLVKVEPAIKGSTYQGITSKDARTERVLSSKKCVTNSDPRNRSFYIQVPKNLGRAAPLLIALHAQGFTADSRSASHLKRYDLWNQVQSQLSSSAMLCIDYGG